MDNNFKDTNEQLKLLELGMEHVLETDRRTMTNPVSDNGWIYDKIWEWLKMVREIKRENWLD